MAPELSRRVQAAELQSMVVTMGSQGAVWADRTGKCGICPAASVSVCDTSGAGDAFCAGVSVGLSCGKSLQEACEIGTRLAAATITVPESVCPCFRPQELGIEPPEMQQLSMFEK